MASNLLDGQSRKSLVNQASTVDITSAPSSVDFGTFDVKQYSRLTGIVLVDSVPDASANVSFAYAASSGTTIITSAVAVSSGGSTFSEINFANFVNLSITNVVSDTTYTALVLGEPIR